MTATDLALHVTEMLRKAKVVGKFVEFYGPGAASLPVADRATIANMAPEYGATMGFFPIDAECSNYLRATGRSQEQVEAFESLLQGAGHVRHSRRKGDIVYSQDLELDLADVAPSVAGPKRPQDRIELPESEGSELLSSRARREPRRPKTAFGHTEGLRGTDASANVDEMASNGQEGPAVDRSVELDTAACSSPPSRAAPTPSNPSVMLAAGLLAKKAVEKGLTVNPRGERPRSRPAPASSPTISTRPACSPTSTSSASRSSATAAPPASATPARSTPIIEEAITKNDLVAAACSPATATSRRASTRASRPTSSCRRRSSSRSRSRAGSIST